MPIEGLSLVKLAALGPVLTVNNRLASSLISQYDQYHLDSGNVCWNRPDILPLSAWLNIQAETLQLTANLLNDRQLRRIWEEIIEQDIKHSRAPGLLQISSSADTACAAQKLLLQYGGNLDDYPLSDDVAAFRRWLRNWHQRSKKGDWLAMAELPALVTQALKQNELKPPRQLTLAGFDLLPPDLESLLEEMRHQGCKIVLHEGEKRQPSSISSYQAADPIEEVEHCARWARRLLVQNPNCRIGIVAPALETYLPILRPTLQAEICPQQALELDAEHPASFSLGTPLAEEGPVSLALSLLNMGNRIELADVGWLLRSPFLGHAEAEAEARALADRELRTKGQSVLPLSRLIQIVAKLGNLPQFLALLKHLRQWVGDHRNRRPGLWSEQMAKLLEAVGWPGDAGIGSREYQLIEKFTELLNRLASLDLVSLPVKRSAAVSLLRRMAQETEFQVEEAPSRIQVLGVLESSGQQFDALWLLGMHDASFPAPARPNPFLPLPLQKKQGMPHADADRELAFSRRTCQRLFQAAEQVVVSWPASIGTAECRPSPLLVGLTEETPKLAASVNPRLLLAEAVDLETWYDDSGPGIPAGIPFKGGTGILKDQALCPFRAFAHYRLLARGLEAPDIGLDPMSRGTLVHGLLESFWKQVRSQQALLDLSNEELTGILQHSAAEALSAYEKESRLDIPRRQRQIELQRLQRIALTWLEKEREREPFEVVETEKSRLLTIAGLAIRTRIDRIDQLPDGRQLIIDYKTGKPDVGQWLDERVTEPQLPIYCSALPVEKVGGALFARVHCRQRENGFHGLLHPDCSWSEKWDRELDSILATHEWSDFEDILQHWTATLEGVAKEFVSGAAQVNPVDVRAACRYCDLLTFCRRLELDLAIEEAPHD